MNQPSYARVTHGRLGMALVRLALLFLVLVAWSASPSVANAGYPDPLPSFPQIPTGGFYPGFPLFSPFG